MQPNPIQDQPNPPIILVKTWCQLLRCDDPEPAEHAKEMLLNNFGNMQGAVEFVKKHKIKV